MKFYGETLKQIRLNKGLLLKEVYTGIVSRPYAIKFEKGETVLNFNHFMDVLDRLNMEYDEFKFVHQGYQNTKATLWKRLSAANSLNDEDELTHIYATYITSHNETYRVIACIARTIGKQTFETPAKWQKEQTIIKNYLLKKETWYLDEINVFTASFYLFNTELIDTFLSNCYRQLLAYRQHKNFHSITLNLLENCILHFISNQNYPLAEKWYSKLINEIEDLQDPSPYFTQIITYNVCTILLEPADQLQKMTKLIQHVSALGFHELSDKLLEIKKQCL